eukprot:gnl/MRDRNA2_/MRDRNA2_118708_c0_seq1.p1 gnl/MRDRNA2_/MRDRNA2_118708_c0~~gnl/MRDRNA2_/MRDRNA2_118708_c0_seq1.p1  ORF type:complete len:442 (-),score=58.18 gnl/MRDRNA2_/MRDRNA2_118708_c0_seq1:113-1372(-)
MQHPDVCRDPLLTGIKRYCLVAQTQASLWQPSDKICVQDEQSIESDDSIQDVSAIPAAGTAASAPAQSCETLEHKAQEQIKNTKVLDVISVEILLCVLDHLSVPGICSFAQSSHIAFDLAHDEGALWYPRIQKWFGGRSASCASQCSSPALYKSVRKATSAWDRSRCGHELSVRGRQVSKVDRYNDVTWAFLNAPFPDDVNIVRWGIRVLYHSDELRIGVTTDPDVCASRRAALSFMERTAHLYSDGSMTHGYNHASRNQVHGRFYREFTTGDVVGIEVHVVSRFFKVFINGVEACDITCGPIPGTEPLWGCIVMDEPGDRIELIPNWTPDRWWGDESTGEASAEKPEWVRNFRPLSEEPSRLSRWSPPWIIPDDHDYEPSDSSSISFPEYSQNLQAPERRSEVEPDEVDWELLSPIHP